MISRMCSLTPKRRRGTSVRKNRRGLWRLPSRRWNKSIYLRRTTAFFNEGFLLREATRSIIKAPILPPIISIKPPKIHEDSRLFIFWLIIMMFEDLELVGIIKWAIINRIVLFLHLAPFPPFLFLRPLSQDVRCGLIPSSHGRCMSHFTKDPTLKLLHQMSIVFLALLGDHLTILLRRFSQRYSDTSHFLSLLLLHILPRKMIRQARGICLYHYRDHSPIYPRSLYHFSRLLFQNLQGAVWIC